MGKVYVVTQGCYSDYHICAMFSTRELAEKFIRAALDTSGRGDEAEIEEYLLDRDEVQIRSGMCPFLTRITRGGDIVQCDEWNLSYRDSGEVNFDANGKMYVICFADDKQHARKIAGEKRSMAIANNKWPEKRG